ncbi:MAG: hypothetical protein ABIJ56_05080 [Pseudomonadota bacterium]
MPMLKLALSSILLLLLVCAGCKHKESAPRDEPARPAMQPLDTQDAGLALDDLNARCRDSWCKGEFSYTFKDLSCGGKQCTLSFTATHESGNMALMSNVTVKGFSAVLEGGKGDRSRGTAESFIDALGKALDTWEDEALAP